MLDAVLETSPDNRDVLVLRAIVAERAGNLLAALLCANRAARDLSANGPPPLELYEVRARLQSQLQQAPLDDRTYAPPAWSWPPRCLLESAGPPSPGAVNLPLTQPSAPMPGRAGTIENPPAERSPAAVMIVPCGDLNDVKIIADPAGQWAASATAGTKYGKTQYAPAQATGAPNINVQGNSPDAWCPENKNSGTDWLEVTFAKPVHATEVRVRQNDAAGAITKIEAIEPDGTTHVWWEGVDPFLAATVREIVWFAVRVPKTSYLVARVKLTLNLASGPGWKEIDAVQLVAAGG